MKYNKDSVESLFNRCIRKLNKCRNLYHQLTPINNSIFIYTDDNHWPLVWVKYNYSEYPKLEYIIIDELWPSKVKSIISTYNYTEHIYDNIILIQQILNLLTHKHISNIDIEGYNIDNNLMNKYFNDIEIDKCNERMINHYSYRNNKYYSYKSEHNYIFKTCISQLST